LVAGPVATLNGESVLVSLTNGVMINNANVTIPDVLAYNGVAHVIDAVLLPPTTDVTNNNEMEVSVFPNPTQNIINIVYNGSAQFQLFDLAGKVVEAGNFNGRTQLDLSAINAGLYLLSIFGESGNFVSTVAKQ